MEEAYVLLDERKKILVSKVNGVDSFDEGRIILKTEYGKMEIKGESLEITLLDLDNGKVAAEGKINGVVYLEEKVDKIKRKGKSTVSRLLN